MTISKYRLVVAVIFLSMSVGCKEDPNALFTELSPKSTGITFKNLVKESEEFNVLTYGYFYQGGGVAIGDINNDGLPDIYFTGNMMASKLYLNKGNFQFEDITESAGVAAAGLWNTGVTMADVNGDGFLDIYICRSAADNPNRRRNVLLINNGDLTFTDRAKEFGLDDPGYSTQATFFDYDRDGDLDMFLLNHSTQEYAGFSRIDGSFKQRKGPYIGDKLFRNDDGNFVDVTEESGILNNVLGFGLALTVTDVNGDGWPDIYVGNDYNEEDYLYINQGDGTFEESLRKYVGHVSMFSMGVDAADLNNDGFPDLLTMDMLPEFSFNQKTILGPENYHKYRELLQKGFYPQTMRNMLHLNQGNGYFSEIGQYAGVSKTDWSWSVLAADFDNDGWKDIFITNGYARNYLDMDFLNYMVSERIRNTQGTTGKDDVLIDLIEKMPPIYLENYLYHNNGDLTFNNKATPWGLGGSSVSNSAAYADLDGDGDLDLVVCQINELVSVYRNNSERLFDRHFLKVRLEGSNKNTKGIGAKVILYAADKLFHQEMIPVRGYQSAVDQELVFGLGEIQRLDSLEVYWPTGEMETMKDIAVDELLVLDQRNSQPYDPPVDEDSSRFILVEGALGLDFTHAESNFLDFLQDRLMPNTMSAIGPKLAVGDVNADGLEDIYIGGGRGQAGQLFVQSATGGFVPSHQPVFELDSAYIDTDAVFFDATGDGHLDLYVVSGGGDFAVGDAWYQDRLYINDGKGNFKKSEQSLPQMYVSGSTVSVGDVDGDGLADLFVGGRYVPGSFPIAPRSYLLKNNGNGTFSDVTETYAPELLELGLTTSAKFVHLNGDKWIDLVVVGEWMEPKIFLNEGGNGLRKKKDAFAEELSGWWLNVTVGDMDGDGDEDLILGNFGENNAYKPSLDQPLRLIYKDFDRNGSIDPVFTYYLADTNTFVFSRDELIGQMPVLKGKFTDYKSFAKAKLDDLFQPLDRSDADTLKTVNLQSVYLENDGTGRFTVHKLPQEAQFSPLYAAAVLDVDGDGYPDILSGGNLSKTRVSIGQQDANHGFVFLGDGKGYFKTKPSVRSGLLVRGDVRDIQPLKVKGKDYIIYTRNNDSVVVFQLIP